MKIGELFKIKRGNSGGQDGYTAGPMPLVAAGTLHNAVVRFVQPLSKDRVFSDVPCLAVAVPLALDRPFAGGRIERPEQSIWILGVKDWRVGGHGNGDYKALMDVLWCHEPALKSS